MCIISVKSFVFSVTGFPRINLQLENKFNDFFLKIKCNETAEECMKISPISPLALKSTCPISAFIRHYCAELPLALYSRHETLHYRFCRAFAASSDCGRRSGENQHSCESLQSAGTDSRKS